METPSLDAPLPRPGPALPLPSPPPLSSARPPPGPFLPPRSFPSLPSPLSSPHINTASSRDRHRLSERNVYRAGTRGKIWTASREARKLLFLQLRTYAETITPVNQQVGKGGDRGAGGDIATPGANLAVYSAEMVPQ